MLRKTYASTNAPSRRSHCCQLQALCLWSHFKPSCLPQFAECDSSQWQGLTGGAVYGRLTRTHHVVLRCVEYGRSTRRQASNSVGQGGNFLFYGLIK